MRALVFLLVGTTAIAAPARLRMATIAPDGTSWARELRALARDFEAQSGGEAVMTWYFGGLAGDELEAVERVRRGQLDGVAASVACERLAPSLQVSRVIGLFENRDEWRYVINRLRPRLDRELLASDFVELGVGVLGPTLVFSRTPVTTLRELQHGRFWLSSNERLLGEQLQAMGIQTVALPNGEAAHAFDEGRTDGFFATATAMLGFQWATRARHFSELHVGFLPACVLVSKRSFDALSLGSQQALRASTAKAAARLDEVIGEQDRQLLDSLFEKQGLRRAPVSEGFRAAFFEAARVMRGKVNPIEATLLADVLAWLADYRAEHQRTGR